MSAFGRLTHARGAAQDSSYLYITGPDVVKEALDENVVWVPAGPPSNPTPPPSASLPHDLNACTPSNYFDRTRSPTMCACRPSCILTNPSFCPCATDLRLDLRLRPAAVLPPDLLLSFFLTCQHRRTRSWAGRGRTRASRVLRTKPSTTTWTP